MKRARSCLSACLVVGSLLVAGRARGAEPVEFERHVIPLLTRMGCNGGACHGASAGRGGFSLSLLGGRPEADYGAIVQALEGRRINLAKPRESLLLAKPGGDLPHGGDVLLPAEHWGAALLLNWIARGAPRGDSPRLVDLRLMPGETHTCAVRESVPLQAVARFSNGARLDVTRFTLFRAADPDSVQFDADTNTARVLRPGVHVLTARYLDRVVACRLLVPLREAVVDHRSAPRANYIDAHVLTMLERLRLPLAPPADDALFFRRAHLDLVGRLPEPEALAAYQAEQDAAKKARLIDRLLASEEFVEFQTYQWGEAFAIRSLPNEPETAVAYHGWLREQLARGTPFNEMARELLTAAGDSHGAGAANFTRLAGNARNQAEQVGRLFLGAHLQCANCHDHPLDRWTQDDFHGLAALFARWERGRHVRRAPRGEVTHPGTGEPAAPRIPGRRSLSEEADPLEAFTAWLAADDERLLARAVVNRLWRSLFGRGLVEPVDDLRATNPASHPELLEELARDFAEHGYDLRHTLRRIALSETYARGGGLEAGSPLETRYFARAAIRPLSPEIYADAAADLLALPARYQGAQLGARAVELHDRARREPLLEALGRCPSPENCLPAETGGLAGELQRLNGPFFNERIKHPAGRLARLSAGGKGNEEIVIEFYLRGLARNPREEELAFWREQLGGEGAPDRVARLEDFLWSLLNSREFSTNH